MNSDRDDVHIINPTNMTEIEKQILSQYLLDSENFVVSIKTTDVCVLKTSGAIIQFKLKNPIIWNDEKSRYEIQKNKSVSPDNTKIFKVKGSLKQGSGTSLFHYKPPSPDKERLSKTEIHDEENPVLNAQREVEISKLNPLLHARGPTVVTDSDTGEVKSTSFYRKIHGQDLVDFVCQLEEEHISLNIRQCLVLFRVIFEAVKKQAHDVGVVHKDIKGENLIVDWPDLHQDPTSVVIDYGLSKYTHEDDSSKPFSGTPGYVSPEIYRKQGSSPKSDVYALGSLFEKFLQWMREIDTELVGEEKKTSLIEDESEAEPLAFNMDMMAKFFQKKHSSESDHAGHTDVESGERAVINNNANQELDSLDELKRQWMIQMPVWNHQGQSESEGSVESRVSSDSDDYDSDEDLFDEENSSENIERQITDFIARMKSDQPDLRPDIAECIVWASEMIFRIDNEGSHEHSANVTTKTNPGGHSF